MRVGWLVAPRPVLAKLILGKQSADLCSSSLAQHFVAAYFRAGDGARTSTPCATSTAAGVT